MAYLSRVYAGRMFTWLRARVSPPRLPADERYDAARQDAYYPHDWPEAQAIAAEWPNADAARREALVDEAETLLSVAYQY